MSDSAETTPPAPPEGTEPSGTGARMATVRITMSSASPDQRQSDPATEVVESTFMPLMMQPSTAGAIGPADRLLSGHIVLPGYRILRVLGKGGMGTVYEAEQQVPRRRVALKVVNPGQASIGMLRRMEREAQVLGLLHHPGIAQIHEAGTFNGGDGEQPFFVMELVEGLGLTEYLNHRNPSTRDRLELLARIADAVHHAHQRGIIHRDLKPDNILVEAGGQPRILDFGVARIVDSEAEAPTMSTRMGAVIGTLPYMSPEQASGEIDKIDTRTDVYALGVIGYEMLAGRLPLEVDMLTVVEAANVIRVKEPQPLSRIDRSLRGDVETIIGKALEKERERRYQSAAEFAGDLRRHLNDEPIIARTPTAMYQIGKFARRNKVLVTASGLVVLALVVGMGLALWQARVAERAGALAALRAEEAKTQAANAQQATDFLAGIFEMIDPTSSAKRMVSARDLLDSGVDRLNRGAVIDPATRLRLMGLIGRAYRGIGEDEASATLLKRTLEEVRSRNPPDPRAEITALYDLAQSLDSGLRAPEAVPYAREGFELARSRFGEMDNLYYTGMYTYGWILYRSGKARGDLEMVKEAGSLLRRRLAETARRFGEESDPYGTDLNSLARVLDYTGEASSETEQLYLRSIELSKTHNPGDHRGLSIVYSNFAGHYHSLKPPNIAKAEEYYGLSLEAARLTAHDSILLTALKNLGDFQGFPSKNIEKSKACYEEYVRIYPGIYDEPTLELANVQVRLGTQYLQAGRNEEALALMKRALEIKKVKIEPCRDWENGLGEGLYLAAMALGRTDEAARLVEEFTAWFGENCGQYSEPNAAALALKAKLAWAQGQKDLSRELRAREKEVRAVLKEQAAKGQ